MGSGCNSNCDNLFEKRIPDTQVRYTGPAITALGICTNDKLSEVEVVILQKLIDYSTGVGISIPDIDLTTCTAFTACLTCCGTCTDLPCLLECYKNAICSIFEDVADLTTVITNLTTGYDVKCLTGVTTNSTLKQILQELLTEFCSLQAQVTQLAIDVAAVTTGLPNYLGNFLLSHLVTCQGTQTLKKTGTGSSAQIQFQGFVPIGTVMPYAGPTAGKFDATGLGLANTDVCGFALANGNNGTVDMREQVPVGAGAGVMGGGALPSNASGANYALNQLVGSAIVTLTGSESGTASHTHTVNENGGHGHVLANWFEGRSDQNESGAHGSYVQYKNDFSTGGPLNTDANGPTASIAMYIAKHETGITINSSTAVAASQAHENRQPSRALLYIQRIN